MASLLKCLLKVLISIFFWIAWAGFGALFGLMALILDLLWTVYDELVRPTTPEWNPLNWIIPKHPPFDIIKKFWDLAGDAGAWIIDKFYHDCM